MKQVQLRYIYAGLLSAFFFVLVYGLMNFSFVLTLLLTVVIYIGSVLLFKSKDIREWNSETVDSYYFLASKCVNQASHINNTTIKARVDEIATYTDEILLSLAQRPKKVEQVFDFFDYYLDITHKVLLRYNVLMKSDAKTSKDEEFLNKTEDYLTKISDGFKRQLDNMKEARMLDIESDIRMFEKTMGLRKSDIEVGDRDELK